MTTEINIPDHDPVRARPSREETSGNTRRERRASTLDRMYSMRLDMFTPEQLDLDNYVYRWVIDNPDRIRQAVRYDYDFVEPHEINDFDPLGVDAESTERVRQFVQKDASGKPEYVYLMKKYRDWFEEDQNRSVANREAMMTGAVRNADLISAPDKDNFYAATGNEIGGAAMRRRGPTIRK